MNAAIEKKGPTAQQWLEQYVTPEHRDRLQIATGRAVDVAKLVSQVGWLVRREPKLQKALLEAPATVLDAIVRCAELNLSPVAGECWIIPRKSRKKVGNDWKEEMTASWQMGYRGAVKLISRAGCRIRAAEIREGDLFDCDLATGEVSHKPSLKRGAIVGAWATATFEDGERVIELLTSDDLARISETSEAWKSAEKSYQGKPPTKDSPRHQWPEEFAKRDAVMRLRKRLPLPEDVQVAFDESQETDATVAHAGLLQAPTVDAIEEVEATEPTA